ncbi:hypothetical protein niasHT_029359 [Heterodera trifolii]|uniref:DM domain-containing protein n=1 Tax=Heterodera trifolii TaxID=157864 RepID=A0ABD2KMF0_9BILA
MSSEIRQSVEIGWRNITNCRDHQNAQFPPPPSPIQILPPVAKTQEIFCHCKRTSAYGTMPKEQYMCQLCANHGQYNQPKKGHKQKCPNRNCACQLCALNTKRRVLDQLERQWRVKKAKGTSKSSERTPEEAKARKRKEKGQENAKQTIGLFDDVECTAKTAAEAMWCSNLPETVKNAIEIQNDKKSHQFKSIELLLEK